MKIESQKILLRDIWRTFQFSPAKKTQNFRANVRRKTLFQGVKTFIKSKICAMQWRFFGKRLSENRDF